LAEDGDKFVEALTAEATALHVEARETLLAKIGIVRTMLVFCKSVPDQWDQHKILAATPEGLGTHALNLDLGVGPLLQTQKLLNSVLFARAKA
jgi:hypothetical protein